MSECTTPLLALSRLSISESLYESPELPLTGAAMRDVPPHQYAMGAAGRTTAFQMAIALGIAVAVAIIGRPAGPAEALAAFEAGAEIAERGWNTVVAFQTRNPMHRAHEELCRMAQKDIDADGILIHMLLGKLKAGDIPADVRDASIRKMVELYFPENTVMIAGYGFDMLYAGPREAVLHAVFRQNAGCTHLIVGRDHAGVGSYYGGFDAQTIFDDEVPKGALALEIYSADLSLIHI